MQKAEAADVQPTCVAQSEPNLDEGGTLQSLTAPIAQILTVVGIRNTVIKIIEFTTKAYYVNMATNDIILKSTSFW